MLSLLAAALLAPPPLILRWAKLDITPPELLPLGGYTERQGKKMVAGGDPLYARVAVLQQGRTRLAVASVEMLTLPESLYREVKARLPKDVALFLCATHTHCAPDSQILNDRMTFAIPGIATYKRRWLTWYADRISKAVFAGLQAPGHKITEADVKSFKIDLNRGRRKGAVPNKLASMVEVQEAGHDRERYLFFHYAAHPTFYDSDELHTREDWPGAMARGDIVPLTGAIGDVSPKAPGLDKAPADQKIAEFASLMWKALDSHEGRPVWRGQPRLTVLSQSIELGKPKPHPTFAKVYKIPEALAQMLVTRFAPTKASITAFRLGKLAIVGVPGEPSSHLDRMILDHGRKIGYASVLVVSHVNGWMGYILDPADYDQGGYEGTLGFYGRDEGLKVVAAADRALDRLLTGS